MRSGERGGAESGPKVDRGLLFEGAGLTLRDNRCCRTDASVSEETRPLEYHEVVFPRRGVWIRHVGRRRVPVDASSVHLFARGTRHRVSHPAGCGDRNTGIALSERALGELAPRLRDRGGFGPLCVPIDDATYAEHLTLAVGASTGALSELELAERAVSLLERVVAAIDHDRLRRGDGGAATPGTRRRHGELAEAARLLLAEPDRHALGLEELAEGLDVSVFHLCRVFRREVGVPLHAYRRSLRIRRAIRLLASRELTLADIAARCGYADRSRLGHDLRRALGRAPSRFRDELEQDPPRRT